MQAPVDALVRGSAGQRGCDRRGVGEGGCGDDVEGGEACCAAVGAAGEEGCGAAVELGEVAPCIGGSEGGGVTAAAAGVGAGA